MARDPFFDVRAAIYGTRLINSRKVCLKEISGRYSVDSVLLAPPLGKIWTREES